MERPQPAFLIALSLASLAGFFVVSRAVQRGRVRQPDRAFRDRVQTARVPAAAAVAEATGPVGKEWLHVPVAAGISLYLGSRTRMPRALIPALSAVTAEALTRALERTLPHRPPPPGHPDRHKPSFPSGHALETTAVAFTTAYVLAREHLLAPQRGFTVAAGLSSASALGRLYLDRHWGSDAVAGALLGISMASAYAALYEMTPSPGRDEAAAPRAPRFDLDPDRVAPVSGS